MKAVYVQWEDHSGWDGPITDDQVTEHGPMLIDSVGILVSEDDQCIRFTQDRYTIEKTHRNRDVAVILKKCITKMQTWEVKDASTHKQNKRGKVQG